jgi:hypothetical protein
MLEAGWHVRWLALQLPAVHFLHCGKHALDRNHPRLVRLYRNLPPSPASVITLCAWLSVHDPSSADLCATLKVLCAWCTKLMCCVCVFAAVQAACLSRQKSHVNHLRRNGVGRLCIRSPFAAPAAAFPQSVSVLEYVSLLLWRLWVLITPQ